MRVGSEGQLGGGNARPVVAYRDAPDTALLERHLKPRRPGVQSVFDEFFKHIDRRGDDLTGSDLAD